MVQIGRYQVGFATNGVEVDEHYTAIYKDNTIICSFPNDEVEEVATLMCSWSNINKLDNFSDEQLIEELRNRNYTGTLNKNFKV